MMRSAFILAALAVACGCSQPLKPAEKEEARRAELELQSVMDMASSRKVSPVEFELGSSRLLPSSFPLLDRVADVLLRYNRLKLIVSGHTDDSGSEGFNENLSMERAGAVKMYLVKKGVYPESIKVYGYGSKLPALKENSDRARALNRRVEFRITTRDWSTVY